MSSFVSDRNETLNQSSGETTNTLDSSLDSAIVATTGFSESGQLQQISPHTTSKQSIITPETIRPHLKGGNRKKTQKRKKVTSTILTDTPNIEEKKEEKVQKQNKKAQRVQKAKVQVVKKSLFDDSSDSEDDVSLKDLCDDSCEISDEFELESVSKIKQKRFRCCSISFKETYKTLHRSSEESRQV